MACSLENVRGLGMGSPRVKVGSRISFMAWTAISSSQRSAGWDWRRICQGPVPWAGQFTPLSPASRAHSISSSEASVSHVGTWARPMWRSGSIEHAQLLRRDDIARFAELGVLASVQPEHAMDDRDVADRYWAGRTDRAFMLAELSAAGVELALGSDAPVAPLDPWVAISAAVGRTRDGREPWHPEQAIEARAALAASTGGHGADVLAGGSADLAIVELDPFGASADELRNMPVAATLLAGRFTHDTL